MKLKQWLKSLLPWLASPLDRAGIRPGRYHYERETDGVPTRFHLRVDATDAGLLLSNASAAARLRPSGVIIAKGLLEGQGEDGIVELLRKGFRDITPQQAAADVARMRGIIAKLQMPGRNHPILKPTDPSFSPEVTPLELPISADVPLTDPKRLRPILDRLWDLGIPHVTLVVGEEPDTAALVQLVRRAETLGLIAGIRGRGTDLMRGSLIPDLARAGVDHVDVSYLSADPEVHDAIAGSGDHALAMKALGEVRRAGVCPVAEVALVESTIEGIEVSIKALAAAEIRNVCFYAVAMADGRSSGGAVMAGELIEAARLVEASAEASQMRYLWYPPVRSHLGSSLSRQVRRGPRCSGDSAIRVEPDGSVIPARGPYRVAGNLLTDRWATIHRSEVLRDYRQRVETDTRCADCPGMAICAADCPRETSGWADGGGKDEG